MKRKRKSRTDKNQGEVDPLPEALSSLEEPWSNSLPPATTYDELPKSLRKFWNRRTALFSKYDEGIRMDEGSQSSRFVV
jgi:hypothetical protein